MARKYVCPRCGREFTSSESEWKHFKNEHVGKLSDESIEYLLLNGVKPDRIIAHGAEPKRVYKIARKLMKEGKL
ncbi:hypothetical protein DRP04_00270 [Archaeoglobales archaeon]|jgi:hypothetical protein|nr:MAG: hypothetical protein DRP04_00270 [Archaeoglobales archaeon]